MDASADKCESSFKACNMAIVMRRPARFGITGLLKA